MTDTRRDEAKRRTALLDLAYAALDAVDVPLDVENGAELDARVRQAFAALDDLEPVFLGCGCPVGAHDNTLDAMRENHPDIIIPETSGLAFYGQVGPASDPHPMNQETKP